MREPDSDTVRLSRRALIKSGVVGAGTLVLPVTAQAAEPATGVRAADGLYVNGYLLVTQANELVLLLDRVEMGQGVERAFALIVASELDLQASQIVVRRADIGRDQNPLLTPPWGTVGSTSVRWAWVGLRSACAQLRQLFLEAAAYSRGGISSDYIWGGTSIQYGQSGAAFTLASLIDVAMTLPLPVATLNPIDKTELDVSLLGQDYFHARATGQLCYGLDVQIPGLLTGLILKPPGPQAKLSSYGFDDPQSAAAQVQLLEVDGSLVVAANSYWEACKAADALTIDWDFPVRNISMAALYQSLQDRLDTVWEQVAPAATHGADNGVLVRDYRVPYLAHFCMEPMNCTVWYQKGRCEVWAPTQRPSGALEMVMSITGLAAEQVTLHTTAMGGGFGRRIGLDYVREATLASMRLGKPVKLVYSRQSDLWGDLFRPAVVARCWAQFDEAGGLSEWRQQVVSSAPPSNYQPSFQRVVVSWAKELLRSLRDRAMGKGAGGAHTLNDYPVAKIDYPLLKTGEVVPTGDWRSVENSYLVFFNECFIDDIAEKLQRDPFEYRRLLTANNPRLRSVLQRLGELLGGRHASSGGGNIGFALFQGLGSYCGAAIEVTGGPGEFVVQRAWIVADVGTVIDRSGLLAQLEGGFLYGLCAALHGELKIENGRYVQENFDDYPVLRINEVPLIEIDIIKSNAAPGGAGELATPLAAPALANAFYRVTGRRITSLPISL